MELQSFLATEESLRQIAKTQQKSLHTIKLNDLTYEIVPMATEENNNESNLDLLFTPINGTNRGAQQYYSSIQLLERMFPEQWESQRTKVALSEKTEVFGPNTQKRILRWAQYKREFAERPKTKDIKDLYRYPAEQLSKLVNIYPGALQDLTRQIGPINWAVNGSGYINYNGLWLLVNYGRITNNNIFVKGSNPCVHSIVNRGLYLEGRILEGNKYTIDLHFSAALDAANFEWINIQMSQDPWVLRLFHPVFRNGLRPDYRRIYSMLMSKAMTAFYTANGERLNLPQHIHMEISRVISDYCSAISKKIGFNKGTAGRTNKGFNEVPRPILREELRDISKWPAPPLKLEKGERGRMNEDIYDNVKDILKRKAAEQFISGQRMENNLYDAAINNMTNMAPSSPLVPNATPFEQLEDDGFELRHYDLSEVSGINWEEPGGYKWTEPTPEGEYIRIDQIDIDFNVKSNRGLQGVKVMAENRRKRALYSAIQRMKDIDTENVKEGKIFKTQDLKSLGWTLRNINAGLDYGILNKIKHGEYVFVFNDWDDYNKWLKEQEDKKIVKYRIVKDDEEIKTDKAIFMPKETKRRAKVDNLLQEQGKTKEEREAIWAASEAREKDKKNFKGKKANIAKSHITVNIVRKDEKTIELENKEKDGTITEAEKRQLQLKRLAIQREKEKREANSMNIKKKTKIKTVERKGDNE